MRFMLNICIGCFVAHGKHSKAKYHQDTIPVSNLFLQCIIHTSACFIAVCSYYRRTIKTTGHLN